MPRVGVRRRLRELERLLVPGEGRLGRLHERDHVRGVDGEPVDLIFLLLAPESAGAEHLKALARVSRVLRNHGKCDKLRTATTPEKIFSLLTNDVQSQAA